ncbi:MAG: hypothetical protein IIY76_04920 [Erysipelotrichaceae bacterium]|nr:hypothetical protein [Erysipelotrichaceae bacterium]
MRPAFSIFKPQDHDYSGGFEQLLRQEKALYEVETGRSELPVTCFEGIFPDWAYDYVKDGGVAVVSGAQKKTFSFDAGFVTRAAVEYIDLSDLSLGKARICSGISVFEGSGKGELTLHENRTLKYGQRPGFYPVFLEKKLGKGTIFYSGVKMAELLTYEGSDLRETSDVLDFDERICSIDKAKISAALKKILMDAMHKAGYPYLSLAYYPDGAKNIFAYSIDGDGLLSEGVDDLLEASKKTETKLVFYINKQLCEDDPDLKEKLCKIKKRDILASHGAVHNAKDGYEENLKDLEIFDQWMKELGVSYEKSYASPRGMYCEDLGRALKEKGYLHSRDFGFAVDDHPYFPICEGEWNGPLQIPCDGFNICRWMLKNKEEGRTMPSEEEVYASYVKQIDYKLKMDQPLLFFCHPQYFGLYAKTVYPKIVEYAVSKGAMLSDYVSYGNYWIRRDQCCYDAKIVDGKLKIETLKWQDDVRLCIDGVIQEK